MKLKELRKASGYTQQKLANKIGVSRSAVAMWESGTDPGTEMTAKLAALFDVSTDYLIGRTGDPTISTQDPDNDHEVWQLREEYRRDPNRRMLFSLSNNGSAKDVRQVAAIIDVLKATNPDFYDGDDPA